MPILWQGTPGRVVGIKDPGVQGNAQFVKMDPVHNFKSQVSIITGIQIAQQTNHQFLHTIGGLIYVYVFGDKVGSIVISGLAFVEDCDGGGAGIDKVLTYYKDTKLSTRKKEIEVTVSRTTIRGFLVGQSARTVDPKTRMSEFQYQIAMIPEDQ